MSSCANIAIALLAAGASTRFGGNKLEADFRGRMLGLAAAETIAGMRFGWQFAVCGPKSAKLVSPLEAMGFKVIHNDTPEAGLSRSLGLAVNAAEATEAVALLICLADMPFVMSAHLKSLTEAFHTTGTAAASTRDSQPMPPAIFPRAQWAELKATEGDRGARGLIAKAVQVEAPAAMLADVDQPSDLWVYQRM